MKKQILAGVLSATMVVGMGGVSEKRTDGPEQYGRTKQKKKGEGDTDMSLMYTEEQKALIALVKEMAENEIKPYVKDADEKGECPKELYKWEHKIWTDRREN